MDKTKWETGKISIRYLGINIIRKLSPQILAINSH